MDKLKKWNTNSKIEYSTRKKKKLHIIYIVASKLGICVQLVSKILKKNPNTKFDIEHTTYWYSI